MFVADSERYQLAANLCVQVRNDLSSTHSTFKSILALLSIKQLVIIDRVYLLVKGIRRFLLPPLLSSISWGRLDQNIRLDLRR